MAARDAFFKSEVQPPVRASAPASSNDSIPDSIVDSERKKAKIDTEGSERQQANISKKQVSNAESKQAESKQTESEQVEEEDDKDDLLVALECQIKEAMAEKKARMTDLAEEFAANPSNAAHFAIDIEEAEQECSSSLEDASWRYIWEKWQMGWNVTEQFTELNGEIKLDWNENPIHREYAGQAYP